MSFGFSKEVPGPTLPRKTLIYCRTTPMAEEQIRFNDGAAYEQMMGIWSRFAGEIFLDWLAPPQGLRWIDVGCGNGAFTELIVERCAPAEVQGIDPSEGQLAFARTRPAARKAEFRLGDAMALPFPTKSFDAAIMALVLVFVPEPAKGVAEMVRVVRPGGIVAAYMWDMPGRGFPLEPLLASMREMSLTAPRPPQIEVSRREAMQDLWRDAGLKAVEMREITVHRTFADFDDFWMTCMKSPSLGPTIAALSSRDLEKLKDGVRVRLPAESDGRIIHEARANAIKGRVPN
jgi:ubiquinone/menaquinone biosynthesis C-methylase UbiE